MKQAVMGALLVFVIGGFGLAQDKQPLFVREEAMGAQLSRPNDEKWKVQEKGRFFGTCIGVTHIIDDLTIDVAVQQPEQGKQWKDLEEIGKDSMSEYRERTKPKEKDKPADFKEFKVIRDEKKAKYPGAGTPNAYYIEAVITYSDDSVKEMRHWIFIKNNALCQVGALGSKGEFAKKQKDADFILRSLQLWKPKPK